MGSFHCWLPHSRKPLWSSAGLITCSWPCREQAMSCRAGLQGVRDLALSFRAGSAQLLCSPGAGHDVQADQLAALTGDCAVSEWESEAACLLPSSVPELQLTAVPGYCQAAWLCRVAASDRVLRVRACTWCSLRTCRV